MIPMTAAEKELSRRVCEALGTVACALLIWLALIFQVEARTACETDKYISPGAPVNVWLIGLLVALCHISLFALLDRAWPKYTIILQSDSRPNWLIIPFAGAFFSCLNVFVAFPRLGEVCAAYEAHWLIDTLGFGVIYGFLAACVMFCFWAFGFVVRYTRGRFSAQP